MTPLEHRERRTSLRTPKHDFREGSFGRVFNEEKCNALWFRIWNALSRSVQKTSLERVPPGK